MKTIRGYGAALGLLLAALLLAGCGGTTPAKKTAPVMEEPVVTPEPEPVDYRAPLMGVWRGEVTIGSITVSTSLNLNASRFVTVISVSSPGYERSPEVVSGSWEATETEVTSTWIDRRTLEKKTLTVPYNLMSHEDLSMQPLVPIENAPTPEILLGLQTPWTAADFVGTWEDTRDFTANGWVRYFELTYNADGTCSWLDSIDDVTERDRDRRDYVEGTCELDLSEHFLRMTVTKADMDHRREPFEGQTFRFAFARGIGEEIIVSPFWEEMKYVSLSGKWEEGHLYYPHGYYWLWLNDKERLTDE